jgi:hypothetical protein
MKLKSKPPRRKAVQPPIVLEGDVRLAQVSREVAEFFGRIDRDQPLRYMLAGEHVFAWLEASGVKVERPYNLEQTCKSFLEWTGQPPIGMPVRK